MKSKRSKAIVGMIVGGSLTVLSPLVGFLGTFSGMHQAFASMSDASSSKTQELSGHISTVLYSNIASLAGVMIGLVISVVSLVAFLVANRKPDAATPSSPS